MGCRRVGGAFGDALAEVDWIVGNVVDALEKAGISENTLTLFTGDNGPWMVKNFSSGSPGIFYGRHAGYWNVGKGSTWEGGIHEAAFAHWPGKIPGNTRSEEVVSSLDVFLTLAELAEVPLPKGRVYDGRSMVDILLSSGGKSAHEILFFYGGASQAILYGLLLKGFKDITIFNRSRKKIKVEGVKKYTKSYNLIDRHLSSADLIINTTPTNPLNKKQTKLINKKTIISDIVYSPKETRFLQNFKENKKIYGITMLIEQAIRCFNFWFGFTPKVDKKLLKKLNNKIK